MIRTNRSKIVKAETLRFAQGDRYNNSISQQISLYPELMYKTSSILIDKIRPANSIMQFSKKIHTSGLAGLQKYLKTTFTYTQTF